MNKLSQYALLVLILLSLTAFQYKRLQKTEITTVSFNNHSKDIKSLWVSDANALIKQFNAILNSEEISTKQYTQTRYHLKRMEALWEFVEHEKYNAKINAAPLLKPEPGSIDYTIVKPEGFQVIDELMVEDNSKKDIDLLIKKLIKQTQNSIHYIKQYPYNDFVFFEGFFLSINRLYNLGLSNFDTPGTDLEFKDGIVLIQYWKEIYSKYYYSAVKSSHAKEADLIKTYLNSIEFKLQNPDELSFINLLRDEILPLQTAIKNLQDKLGVEFMDERSPLPLPTNPRAENFMKPDFLNTSFFAGINKEDNTKDLQKLGKILFNDPILSGNNKRACASCHDPKMAFADGKSTSIHFDGKNRIKRNSPGLINSVFAKDFFHDLRAESLQDQADHVINNPDEFKSNFKDIALKLEQSEDYKALFNSNFKDHKNPISKHSITEAIAAYISSLQSFNSPFDQFVNRTTDDFDMEASKGYDLFMGKAACATCHFAPTFAGLLPPFYNDTESEILGVWETFVPKNPVLDKDMGRGKNGKIRSELDIYLKSFKTVTLRNIVETKPYMHHGKFETLQNVLEFYNVGGGLGSGLEVAHQTLSGDSLGLNQTELNQLETFMQQLSDNPFANDKPLTLPTFENQALNNRQWGGEY